MRTASIFSTIALAACGAANAPPDGDALAEWNAWRAERRDEIAGEDGWLTLIGLHWLEDGEATIGSDPASTIVLPADRSPSRLGRLLRAAGDVAFVPEEPFAASIGGAQVTERVALVTDDPGPPTILEVGSLRLHVIARADRRGLRVKDRASPARESFAGLRVFDHDPRLRIHARVVPPSRGEVLPLVNVLGMEIDEPVAGHVRFELGGASHSLVAIRGGEALFVMFRDETAGAGETYGAGRYLDVPPPDANGETWIDFNYAYTPPCAFTELATCPLAPPENTLPVAIRAGERFSARGH
jgi:uncharacterized protein